MFQNVTVPDVVLRGGRSGDRICGSHIGGYCVGDLGYPLPSESAS